jgi:photosystem II stability/assembly factor-like uncharacterized protein
VCNAKPGLPAGAPVLSTTDWTNINDHKNLPSTNGRFAQGLAVSPCNPSVLYLSMESYDSTLGGIFRSTDAGANWARVGRVAPDYAGVDIINNPVHVRVDPNDPLHVYAVGGVRGSNDGFWVSTDGGDTFVMPDNFANLDTTVPGGLKQYDVYDIAVDPTDFNHFLLAFHGAWGWTDSKWNTNSGVLESNDGGTNWIVHEPLQGWGTGHAITFLYKPELNIGNRNTWLLGTQGNGMWRTTDAGKTWNQVTQDNIQHGGGTVYYDKTGVLYASGSPHNLRSDDNGLTWTEINDAGGYNTVFGDGNFLYTRTGFNQGRMLTSPEGSDGKTWTEFGTQPFDQGPFEMALDPINGILYTSSWGDGIWALKVAPR